MSIRSRLKNQKTIQKARYLFIQKIRNGTGIRQIQIQKVRSRVTEILNSDTRVPILSPVTVQVSLQQAM